MNDEAPRFSTVQWQDEIVYHVMPRSFRDSNGDGHGDFRGLTESLDYLEALGVTAILMAPIYASDFYHNYFPTDYEEIDPEYGTREDYFAFVRALHARGMKLILDQETQYAQSGHRWLDESWGNPDSEYSDFIYYSDEANQYPEQFLIPSGSDPVHYRAWPDGKFVLAHLDMNHPTVRQFFIDYYAWWLDPNGDGNFDDGVDGFRIDHIMDDLDNKGLFTNLYEDFWRPIFEHCRRINPAVFVVGEQADWGTTGIDMIRRSGADASFNFALKFAISGEAFQADMYSGREDSARMDPATIHQAVLDGLQDFDSPPWSLHFVENHDTERWASMVEQHEGKLRAGAVLMLTLPGVPSIYYGQELGLPGKALKDIHFDANHIPVREAFPWSADASAPEVADWYRGDDPWWTQSIYNSESIQRLALPAQRADDNSLWHHYRALIALRKASAPLRRGSYEVIDGGCPSLMAFRRTLGEESIVVMQNLSEQAQALPPGLLDGLELRMGAVSDGQVPPWGFAVFD